MPKSVPSRQGSALADIYNSGSAKIKKKIRDIERLLKKDNVPANIRIDNERALKALKVELANKQQDHKTQKIAKKYHMVRFFERKKALRKLKQARKELQNVLETGERKDIKKARKVVRHCEIDVAYVVLFPKAEKYISLYPNHQPEKNPDTENAKKGLEKTESRRRELKKKVEKLVDDKALPFSIDDLLEGKSVDVKHDFESGHNQEIDAPETKIQEEDDFFE